MYPGCGSGPCTPALPTLPYTSLAIPPPYTVPPSPLVVHASTEVARKDTPVKDCSILYVQAR